MPMQNKISKIIYLYDCVIFKYCYLIKKEKGNYLPLTCKEIGDYLNQKLYHCDENIFHNINELFRDNSYTEEDLSLIKVVF